MFPTLEVLLSERVFIALKGHCFYNLLVCVEVVRPSQHNVVMSSMVSLPNHTFTGQA